MALTTTLPRDVDYFASLPQSDYIEVKLLGTADTAELIVIPADASGNLAKFVLLSGSGSFAAKLGTAAVVAAMNADTTTGNGSMLNPTFRRILPGQTHLSVVSSTLNCVVSAEFFLDIPRSGSTGT